MNDLRNTIADLTALCSKEVNGIRLPAGRQLLPLGTGYRMIQLIAQTVRILLQEVAFPDGSTVGFSGFVKSHTIGSAEVDGAIGFGATIRISGPVVVTEAA